MRRLSNIHTFDSLKLRDFRLLWLGQLATSMGLMMDQTARSWLIYQLTGSPLQLGFVSAVRGLPLLIFGVLAGVVADRYGRKAQLIIAQVVNAALNIALATLILTGRIQVWHVYVTGFLNGTVQAFQQPARQVLINDLAGEKHLMNAVALNSAAFNLSRSLGPAFCGILIEAFNTDIAYYVQGVMYLIATVWTVQMVVPKFVPIANKEGTSTIQSVIESAREGIAYIANHRLILALMVLGLAPIFLGMPYTSLMPIFAIDILHGNAGTQGLLLTSVGVGAVLGALAIASMGQGQGNGKLLIAGAAGFGLGLVLFSQSKVLWMALIFTFIAGLSNSSYTSQDQTIIQVITPDNLRGRVIGIYFLNRGLIPLGSLIAGILADVLGGPWAVTIMGGACVLLSIGVPAFVPELWRLKAISPDAKEINKSG